MRIYLILILISCSACSLLDGHSYVQLTGSSPGCRYVEPTANDSFKYKYECGSVVEKEVLLYSRRRQRTANWLFEKEALMGWPANHEYSQFKITRFEVANYVDTRVYFHTGGLNQGLAIFYLLGYMSESLDTEIKIWGVYMVSSVMSTAKRLVLSLRGRKESQSTAGTSSTRLVSGNSSSPGHELDEIAVVSGSGESTFHGGNFGNANGPRFVSDSGHSRTNEAVESDFLPLPASLPNYKRISSSCYNVDMTTPTSAAALPIAALSGQTSSNNDNKKSSANSCSRLLQPRLSLNGATSKFKHLVPQHLRGRDVRATQPTTPGNDACTELSLAPPVTDDHFELRSLRRYSVDRQSLTDIGSKFGMSRPHFGQSVSQQGFFSSHDSLTTPCVTRASHPHVSATASEMDLSRKARRKERGRLKPGEQPLLGSWNRSGARSSHDNTIGTTASTNILNTGNSCNGTDRFGRRSGCSSGARGRNSSTPGSAHFTFVFDPAGRLCYYWSMVVSLAFLYNFWVIIYRFAFQEINGQTIVVWFCLDYFSDFLYLVDILFHFRTGYLEDGVLQTDSTKLRQHYMNSTTFYIDCLCLLPLDFLYLSIGFNSILRSFRLVKIYRFWAFMDRTERHTNYPNLFRSTSLIHYLLVIFHWNGCLYHIIHKNNGFGSRNWVFHDSESADVVKQYLQSYYWCTLALTTIGDLPKPRSKGEYVFVILQLLFGLMLFATVLGHVANIVTSVSAARKEFQAKLDGVKTYMRMRRVPNHLQVKVIKWFDYLWLTQKCSDEERAVSCLPDKLKAEIAINVHLDTLKRVEIFQNTEAGFLCELVLRLRPVLFSPGDYICRKGEVGKEMYIVNRGRLQVVADNGKTVMASLKAGSYFGEISILNMGTAGNRRTASVRSVGYSDLFVLSKKDMWDVLKEYPAARVRLESIAVKRLEKYKKAPLEKAAMGRCQSTPGLVESEGRTTLEDMWLPAAPLVTYNQQSTYSRAPSPRSQQTIAERPRTSDSPGSMSPSVHSSDDRPRSRATSHHSRPHSQPSRAGPICGSISHLESCGGGATPLLGSHEALEDEIKRLRERLHTVEAENQALNTKLSQQQWELENRLAEIEMQICGASSASSIDPEHETEELERNRESII